jgi:hypothetical protein
VPQGQPWPLEPLDASQWRAPDERAACMAMRWTTSDAISAMASSRALSGPCRSLTARYSTMTSSLNLMWVGLLAASLTAPLALAQSGASSGSLGGGKGDGPIMTREELRTCVNRQEVLGKRRAEVETERKALDDEKAVILAETEALKGARGQVGDTNARISAVNQRMSELSRKINSWNLRVKEFEAADHSGPDADRQKQALSEEKRELERESASLDAERAALSGALDEAASFNKRATVLEQRVLSWNERNGKASKASEDLVLERDRWAVECGNRRYLIDDETAIKKGQ